jgi:hypothetical protein
MEQGEQNVKGVRLHILVTAFPISEVCEHGKQ